MPGKRVHVRKRLRSTTEEGTTVTLTFEDDTDTTVDAVIRCDGIRSSIRKIVLGQDHPASEPVHAGTYNYIALLPMEEARRKIDCDRHKEGQVGWLGDGGFLMHDPSSNKETLQIVAAIVSDEAWNPEDWSKSVRAERVKNDLSSWGTLGESLTEVLIRPIPQHTYAGLT